MTGPVVPHVIRYVPWFPALAALLAPVGLALPLFLLIMAAGARGTVAVVVWVTLVVGVAAVAYAWTSRHPSLTLTAEGVIVRNYHRTHRIDWPDVARIEICSRGRWIGSTVIATTSGARHLAVITSPALAWMRGGSLRDHGPDYLTPAPPTMAAVAAHRAYLAGELG